MRRAPQILAQMGYRSRYTVTASRLTTPCDRLASTTGSVACQDYGGMGLDMASGRRYASSESQELDTESEELETVTSVIQDDRPFNTGTSEWAPQTNNAMAKALPWMLSGDSFPKTTAEAIEWNKERRASGNWAVAKRGESMPANGTANSEDAEMMRAPRKYHFRPSKSEKDTTTSEQMNWWITQAYNIKCHKTMIRLWEEIKHEEEKGNMLHTLKPRSYQNLMRFHADHGSALIKERVFDIFDHMLSNGQEPGSVFYHIYFKTCSTLSQGQRAMNLMKDLEENPRPNFNLTPAILSFLVMATARSKMLTECTGYYELLLKLDMTVSTRAYQAYMNLLLASEGSIRDALSVADKSKEQGVSVSHSVVNRLVYSCLRKGSMEDIHRALDYAAHFKNVLTPLTVQNLLFSASKNHDVNLLTKTWITASAFGHTFSELDYNFTVVGLVNGERDRDGFATMLQAVKAGHKMTEQTIQCVAATLGFSPNRMDKAYYTLASMHEAGEEVPLVAVNMIVAACANKLAVDRCFSTTDAISRVFGLKPDLFTYNNLMRALAGMRDDQKTEDMKLQVGYSLLDKMDDDKVTPDAETMKTLLRHVCACDQLTEAKIESVVKRMEGYGVGLNKAMISMVARSFHDRNLKEVADRWALKVT
ncbi:unnamed protein product [Discosporangium mesarthrocarpum]